MAAHAFHDCCGFFQIDLLGHVGQAILGDLQGFEHETDKGAFAPAVRTGEGETIKDIVGSANPYKSMMWASFIGALVAAGMSVGRRILSAHETVDAWYGGARATLFGMIVLVLAWSMSDVTSVLDAKGYLISIKNLYRFIR